MRPALRIAPVLLALAVGCGTTVVWQGKTRDRRATVLVEENGKQQWVRVGGAAGPLYEGIGVDALTVSAGGDHVAYPARRGPKWLVVHDGRELGPWDGVGELCFSPDGAHLAFSAERDGGWYVVVDGNQGPRFDSVFARSLIWSSGSSSLAYAAGRAGRAHAVRDQLAGPAFDVVGRLVFAGARLVYTGRTGSTTQLVIDGVADAPEERIGDVAVSPDGTHVAHVIGTGVEERLVVDGREVAGHGAGHFAMLHVDDAGGLTFALVEASSSRVFRLGEPGPELAAIKELTVTPAGRWAYLARQAAAVLAVVDGVPRPACEWAADLAASPDGKHLAYLARCRGRSVVVHDEHETPVDAAVAGTLVWSRDSRHWACLAGDPRTRDIFVSIDGVLRRPFEVRELVFLAERQAASPGAVDENRALREIVAGELELALASRPTR